MMPTDHDAIAALPNTGAVREYLRALLFRRAAYVLADGDNPQDLIAVDPETGAAVICLVYLGRLFLYDPTDTTTAHDGVTVLVTQGGRRYKLDTLQIPRSVLDKDLVAPPPSPAIGDAYLIVGAPSGGWATFAVGSIVVLTARGWEAIAAPIGSVLFVRDEGGYYHKSAGGTWAAGLGSTALTSNSVLLSSIVNAGRFFSVENQTTNTPPSSPQGTAYIIGPSPTGSWAGHAGKIAIREATGTGNSYAIYSAVAGMRAYDKAQGRDFQFNGVIWQSATGRSKTKITVFTASGTFSKDARCIEVKVTVIGCGGSTVANGGDAWFGAHCYGSGGMAGSVAGGAGFGGGGDLNLAGINGALHTYDVSGFAPAGYTLGTHGIGSQAFAGGYGGGGGGAAIKTILAEHLADNEVVTIQALGASNGVVVVEEKIEI